MIQICIRSRSSAYINKKKLQTNISSEEAEELMKRIGNELFNKERFYVDAIKEIII
jgi:hypothetical protein